MTDRNQLITEFLNGADWRDAKIGPLAGDASNRRYLRLRRGTQTAVLMDAPPDKGEDVRPFIDIATYLSGLGLSSPKILHRDISHGFLLLEDLGDDLYAKVVATNPPLEAPLYQAAVDVLVALHQAPPPDNLARYDSTIMAEMAALSYRWYLRGAGHAYEDRAVHFQTRFKTLLTTHCPDGEVLIQRDFHAENLLWLPDRHGLARVGLLDFQDAMTGHRSYDLVSLLQDARRDVPPEIETAMIDRYLAATGLDRNQYTTVYAVLGVQRNLRILGVFARLCMYSGKAHYVDFIPRVWGYLMRDLDHPALLPVRQMLLDDLPAPTPSLLESLKKQCATIPTL